MKTLNLDAHRESERRAPRPLGAAPARVGPVVSLWRWVHAEMLGHMTFHQFRVALLFSAAAWLVFIVLAREPVLEPGTPVTDWLLAVTITGIVVVLVWFGRRR